MSRGKHLLPSLFTALLAATPAIAQTNLCDELRGRYANVDQVIGASAATRQLSRAIVQQSTMIRRLEDDIRNQGCSSDSSMVIVGSGNSGTSSCDQMQSSLDHMQQDLGSVMDERELSLTHAGAEAQQRRKLLAIMQQNGCSPPASAVPDDVINTRIKQEPGIFEEQSSVEPESSITTIQTRKPASDVTPVQKQAPATIQTQAQAPQDRPYDPSTNKVRQVGPQFLATDQGGIDLKHPKAAGPQPTQ
ncbi:MAG: hypothetical protein KGI75_27240 [Rhizobiaceae bacterium]|nr:hypothetical protein [Rhizobiaceae bacterium]